MTATQIIKNQQYLACAQALPKVADDLTLLQNNEDANEHPTQTGKRASKQMMRTHLPTLNETKQAKNPNPTFTPVLASEWFQKGTDGEKGLLALQQMISSFDQCTEEQMKEHNFTMEQAHTAIQIVANASPEAPEPTPAEKKVVSTMFEIMVSIMLSQVQVSQNDSTVSQSTNTLSSGMAEASHQAAVKAAADLKEYNEEVEEQADKPWYDKLFDALKSIGDLIKIVFTAVLSPILWPALGSNGLKNAFTDEGNDFLKNLAGSGDMFQYILAGAMMIFGGPAACIMGAFMLAMTASQGGSKLDAALEEKAGGTLWKKILLELSVAVAEAVVLGGVGGALTTGLDALAGTAAKTAGTEAETAAAKAAAEAAAKATAEAAAASAASAVAEDSVPVVEEELSENALLTSEKKIAEKAAETAAKKAAEKSLLDKIIEKGFGSGSKNIAKTIAAKSIMMAGTTKTWSDLVKGLIEIAIVFGAKVGNDKEEEVSEIAGAALGAVLTIGAGFLDSAGSAEKLNARLFDPATFRTLNKTLQGFIVMTSLLSSGSTLLEGLALLKQGDILDDLAVNQGAQTLYGDMLNIVNQMISSNTATSNTVNSDYIAANSQWEAILVTPWNVA